MSERFYHGREKRTEGNVLLNDALNTFYLRFYGEREREMFYLTTHSTHFIYDYMASDTWYMAIQTVREETRCIHIGYSLRLAARVLLYSQFHRQDSTYLLYRLWNTGWNENKLSGSITGDRSVDPSRHKRTFYHGATS